MKNLKRLEDNVEEWMYLEIRKDFVNKVQKD